ncbi:MAG: sigma-70 family RNA polymerase sigma factor [Verrucomicrobia bacterium]|nr:sigma-70 family RNA polymerase sigma factor [Verrucomicrobiota bacterium]MBV8481567.1 sigma-70 family RNA polymerase sigma factor [Verrucomicrobiota bacterium]
MEGLAQRFEENRAHLRSVAYRMLGSIADAEDAVQETWLRLSRTENTHIDNMRGWLTTVVSRISLDMLRSRSLKREQSLDTAIPDFIVSREGNPQDEAVLADSVGLALLVLLDTLTPAERLAFVLHDMFALPFEEIAPIVGRSSTAARKLASRARMRVQGAALPDKDTARQREVVDAFVAAAHTGNLESLIALLDPNVVLLGDRAPALKSIRGAAEVAKQALGFSKLVQKTESVLVNGTPGILSWLPNGKPMAVLGFVVSNDRIVEIYVLSDPNRLQKVIERA